MSGRKIFVLLISAIIAGCASDEDIETMSIGKSFIKPQTQVVMIDTFSLNMSTVKIDSIQTSGTGVLLAGAYTDPNFGSISSMAYFPITLPDTTKLPDGSVFDSLTIILNYNGKWYGDTTKPLTLNIYHVTEAIEPTYDWYLYNTSGFSYEPEPVGTATFNPRPGTDKSVELRLSDKFGNSMTSLFLNDSDQIASESEFIDFFNGLAIGPEPGSKAVLGFEAADSVLHMVLYTHYVSSEKHQTILRFPMYADGNTCNQITSDHSGTNLAGLVTQKEELNSGDSENKTYLQGGTGIATRFDFPGMNRLLELNKGSILYKAELVFKPYPRSYTITSLPTSLNLYKTDKFNRMVSLIADDDDNAIAAEYSFDFLFGEETWYRFDITDFLVTELEDSYFDPDVGLLVTLDETAFQSTLDRVVFDARPNKSFKPVLQLYFLYYD
jgi:hypothetical protein